MNFFEFSEALWHLPTSRKIRQPNYVRPEEQDNVYRALNPKHVEFVVKETVDEIIAELRKNGEQGDLRVLSLIKNPQMPYYSGHDEMGSIRWPWVDNLRKRFHQLIKATPATVHLADEKIEDLEWDIMEEVGPYLRKVLIEELGKEDFEIRVYGGKQGYGGPEEGGWWYTHWEIVKQIPVKGLKPAYRKYLEMDREMKGQGKDSFYKDIEKPSDSFRMASPEDDYEQEGMWIQQGWTTSEYKKYLVTLNLPSTPLENTQERPHYE